MPDIIRRDEVVKRQAQEYDELVNRVIDTINDTLNSTKELPVFIKDGIFTTLLDGRPFIDGLPRSKPLFSITGRVKNEVMRRIKESGWTIDIKSDGFQVS